MNNTIQRYWMLVASKNHVLRGVKEGIAQAATFLSSANAVSIVGIDLVVHGGFTSIMKE